MRRKEYNIRIVLFKMTLTQANVIGEECYEITVGSYRVMFMAIKSRKSSYTDVCIWVNCVRYPKLNKRIVIKIKHN